MTKDRFAGIFMVAVLVFGAAVASNAFGNEQPPVPLPKPRPAAANQPVVKPTTKSPLCMLCVGLHYNIMNGKIGVFSIGPGIGF